MKRSQSKQAPIIAVINGAADVVEVLETCLRTEGFNTASTVLADLKSGKTDFLKFLEEHNPLVIIYDVPPPYDQNLTFLRLLMDTHAMDERCVILTTTNTRQLQRVTGEKAAIEIVGKPYDLDLLIRKVREKIKQCERAAA